MKKLLLALILFLTACTGEPPQNLGVRQGKLTPCPESPNCVSSFESSEEHSITPLAASLDQIQKILLGMDEANIVEVGNDYLYVEFTSRIIGYVDDVEFLSGPTSNLIHVRSASRLGHSDLGANRKRIEAIRTKL
jgi:uncharacterized protein (DUF1499 family)